MVIYTILSPEEVLRGMDEQEMQDLVLTELEGVSVLVERSSPISGRIIRILSSNPNDFLNPYLQPGVVVPLEQLD
jgi:hypothetical protein